MTGGPRSAPLQEVAGTVFGIRVRGKMPEGFGAYLWPGDDARGGGGKSEAAVADLELTYRELDVLPDVEPLWESPEEEPAAAGPFALFPLEGGFGLRVAGRDRGVFRCAPRRIDVEWATSGGAAAHHLFSYALPLWLETRGVPVLHGSAVRVGGRAMGFLGPTGMGKSVLCAELVRRGCGFLSDDGLALLRGSDGTWHCPPGPPLLRLWPSGLTRRLDLDPEPLPRVWQEGDKRRLPLDRLERPEAAGGGAAGEPAPLEAFCVLRRRPGADGPVILTPTAPRDGLVRLIGHGVAAAPAAALGLAHRRLEILSEVAEEIPVWHLDFPSGAGTAGRILDALRNLPPKPPDQRQ